MDFSVARRNMVESQLRTNKITQDALLDAMREVPRELFLPKRVQHLSYVDEDAPLGNARYETEPMVLATMIQALDVRPDDFVLIVGAATGYSAAVLGRLAKTVFAVEEDETLSGTASSTLTALACDNAVVVEGALTGGLAQEAPYDAILLNGAVSAVPEALVGQLKEGGRLVAVIRETDDTTGRLVLVAKQDGVVSERLVANASIPFLSGFEPKPAFAF